MKEELEAAMKSFCPSLSLQTMSVLISESPPPPAASPSEDSAVRAFIQLDQGRIVMLHIRANGRNHSTIASLSFKESLMSRMLSLAVTTMS